MFTIEWLDALIERKQQRHEPLPLPSRAVLIGDDGHEDISTISQLAACMRDARLDKNHYIAIEAPGGGWIPSDFLWALIALRLYEKE